MSKFLIAEKRLFRSKICMKCNAHNPQRADKCKNKLMKFIQNRKRTKKHKSSLVELDLDNLDIDGIDLDMYV